MADVEIREARRAAGFLLLEPRLKADLAHAHTIGDEVRVAPREALDVLAGEVVAERADLPPRSCAQGRILQPGNPQPPRQPGQVSSLAARSARMRQNSPKPGCADSPQFSHPSLRIESRSACACFGVRAMFPQRRQ